MTTPNPETLAAPPGARRRHWLGVALAVFILIMLGLWLDFAEVGEILSRMPLTALVALIVLIFVDRVVMAWKWLLLLRVGGVDLPLWRVTRWYLQGTISGAFMPSMVAGDLLRGYWASRPTGRPAFVFASLLMEKMLGFLSAIHWGIAGGAVLLGWFVPNYLWLWITLAIAAVICSGAGFALSLHARVHEAILAVLDHIKGRKVLGFLHRLYEAYSHFSTARAALLRNYLITILEHLLQITFYVLIAAAIGALDQPLLFVAVTTLHTLIMRIPISPEGWGVGELSAIALYGLIGIEAEAAFAIMLIYHIAVLIACSPGIVFLLRGEQPAAAPVSSGRSAPAAQRTP